MPRIDYSKFSNKTANALIQEISTALFINSASITSDNSPGVTKTFIFSDVFQQRSFCK